MTHPIRALLTLGFSTLSLLTACGSSEAGPPSPYASADGFCEKWAEAACNKTVTENCGAASADACVTSQATFCASLIQADHYARKYAPDCVKAVKAAYLDAKLTRDEYEVVRRLGGVCAKVLSGAGGQGAACSTALDCNTLDGLTCVTPPGKSGSCQKPEIVSGGNVCGGDAQVCADGLYCNGANCIANASEGAACGADVPCADGLGCLGDDTAASCQRLGAVSDECATGSDCASTICAVAPSATTGICVDTVVLSQTEPACTALR